MHTTANAFFRCFPDDFTRIFIRTWIYPSLFEEFWKREHQRRWVAVLEDLRECFPDELMDDYIVSSYGTCVLLFPRMHFFLGRCMYARLDPLDARRLSGYDNCCFFSIGYINDIPDGTNVIEVCLHTQYGRESFSVTFAKYEPGFYRQCIIIPSDSLNDFFSLMHLSDTHRRFRTRHLLV